MILSGEESDSPEKEFKFKGKTLESKRMYNDGNNRKSFLYDDLIYREGFGVSMG